MTNKQETAIQQKHDVDPLAERKKAREAHASLEQRQTVALEIIADELTLIRLSQQE